MSNSLSNLRRCGNPFLPSSLGQPIIFAHCPISHCSLLFSKQCLLNSIFDLHWSAAFCLLTAEFRVFRNSTAAAISMIFPGSRAETASIRIWEIWKANFSSSFGTSARCLAIRSCVQPGSPSKISSSVVFCPDLIFRNCCSVS